LRFSQIALWLGRGRNAAREAAPIGHRSPPRPLGIDNVENATNTPEVKAQLRANTEQAIAAGVFGVPTLRVGGEMFWGNDASAMVDDWLADPNRFDNAEYRRIATLPVGVERPR